MAFGALPPLTWIRAFEVSARHLSFTQAARELNLTQAAISKQIKLLEQHLRQPLFVRLPRSLSLTKSGEAYLPKVRDALERLDSGTQEVFGRQRGNIITIRSAVSFAVNWLAPRIPAFLARHGGTRIRLISSVWNEANSDPVDLDIRYGTGGWAGSICHRLTYEKLMPLASPEIAARLLEPSSLRHYPLLHVLGYQEGWSTWLGAAGVQHLDPGSNIQCDTSLAAFALAAHGFGVALGRSSVIGDCLVSGRLVAPFGLAVPVDEAFYLVVPNGALAPEVQQFADWLLCERQSPAP